MPNCMICKNDDLSLRHPRVRDKENIEVLECKNCGLVFLSSFAHITDNFYEKSGMLNWKVEIDEYRGKSFKDDHRRFSELDEKILGKKVLDFGCGAGGFLHLIKDRCVSVAGVELDNTLNKIINEEGIECFDNLSSIKGKYDVITLFHVLEHLINPQEILVELQNYLNPNGIIIIEVPNADDALLTLYKSEEFANFTYWSCHVVLYNAATLKMLIDKCSLNVNYIKQIQRYPLSNHLYWLSKKSPGGHQKWSFLDKVILNTEYESMLAAIGKCDTLFAEVKIGTHLNLLK
ncbi:class I SAM-dependent methyltransferase [Sporosarcina sp. PTS2304]|uniref:class I SAM-dependent methyltransferase n=1 Tax=Sporosarcina sp. PTS2304 TaxID=2283194 RepID=UPI000E0DECE2|nr:class I SAM-dependent methyltransferase [Sporosarcina sp. PTS2304]AXI01236.1 class I SAM-dependent methyltransferase [Sporosarcina sp. PTS2304]